MVKVVELHGDAVTVLELLFEEQRGVKLQLEFIIAQLLDVLFNYDFNRLTWETKKKPNIISREMNLSKLQLDLEQLTV